MVLIYLEDRKGSFLPTHLPSFLSSTDAPNRALPQSPSTALLLCIVTADGNTSEVRTRDEQVHHDVYLFSQLNVLYL